MVRAKPALIGASLSWNVDKMFTSGTRRVEFTLRSAFNITGMTNCAKLITGDKNLIDSLVSAACNPAIDVESTFGFLCFDQFVDPSPNLQANLSCNARYKAANNFNIQNYDSETIRGVAIVYGELRVNFTVDNNFNYVAAYLNRADKTSADIIASFANGMYTNPTPAGYWSGFPTLLLSSALWTSRTPACTTIVRLCEAARCGNASARPPNYFSPNPLLPLLLPAPANGIALKAFDYDGHPMRVRTELTPGLVVVHESLPALMQAGGGTLPGFFDLALDPARTYTDPGTPGLRGPTLNFTAALPGGAATAEYFVAVSDTVYDVLEVGSAPTTFKSTSHWQDGSAIVGTVYTGFRPAAACTADRVARWVSPAVTEVFCSYASTRTNNCQVRLVAETAATAMRVKIVDALGFAGLPSDQCSDSACADACSLNSIACPCCCYSSANRKDCTYTLPLKTVEDVGRFFVQCVSAIARPTDSSGLLCPSAPVCFKIHVYGTRPRFVAPTPLAANSEDDNGILMRGRTDVQACLGYPLQLPLVAVDDDTGDQVRIFVEDKFNPLGGDRTGWNFFAQEQGPTPTVPPVDPEATCQRGQLPFRARRIGDNAAQAQMQTLDPERAGVMGPYAAGVAYAAGPAAAQNVSFTLNCSARNGIVCDGSPPYRLNLNPVICGWAYDASRRRYGRWVGARNPKRPSAGYLSDHSLGDYASDMHCWRIRLQAPPEIGAIKATYPTVRGPEVIYEPLDPAGPGPESRPGDVSFELSVGTVYRITFDAADPNPEDRVTIFLVGDTGLPDGAKISGAPCFAMIRCRGQELHPTGAYIPSSTAPAPKFYSIDDKDAPHISPCSASNLTVEWNVTSSHAGRSFRLCAVARDDSPLCEGRGPADATSRGWFGAERCAAITVPLPEVRWAGPDSVRGGPADLLGEAYEAFVGCRFTFRILVLQLVYPNSAAVELVRGPPGAATVDRGMAGWCRRPWRDTDSLLDKQDAERAGPCRRVATLEWSPARGTEGGVYEACLLASNSDPGPLRVVAFDGYCAAGPARPWAGGAPCRLADGAAACGGGAEGVCVRACVRVAVGRCRYCVAEGGGGGAGGGPLWAVRSLLGIDIDWLRLWTLNADTPSALGLGSACTPQLDCFSRPASRVLNGPDLAMPAGGGSNKTILWAGTLARARLSQPSDLAALAARFRTTARSLLSLNPDLLTDPAISGAAGAGEAGLAAAAADSLSREVCVSSCSL